MVSLIKILILGCVTGFISALPTNILISEDIVSNKYPYSNRNIYLSIGALLSNIFLLLFFNTTITFLFNINKYIINYIFILLGITINFFIFNYFTNNEFFHKETSKSNIKYLNASSPYRSIRGSGYITFPLDLDIFPSFIIINPCA